MEGPRVPAERDTREMRARAAWLRRACGAFDRAEDTGSLRLDSAPPQRARSGQRDDRSVDLRSQRNFGDPLTAEPREATNGPRTAGFAAPFQVGGGDVRQPACVWRASRRRTPRGPRASELPIASEDQATTCKAWGRSETSISWMGSGRSSPSMCTGTGRSLRIETRWAFLACTRAKSR